MAATGPPFEKDTLPPFPRVGGGTAGIRLAASVSGLGWESSDGPPTIAWVAGGAGAAAGTAILSARLTRLSTDWLERLGGAATDDAAAEDVDDW